MSRTCVIASRELASQFLSPIAYVVLGLFALGATLIFILGFGPGAPAGMRSTYEGIIWLMPFLVPAISMRLVAEELRNGTIEPLMTAPVSDLAVVVGKWLGALLFFVVLLAVPVIVQVAVLEFNGSPDYGPILTGFLGLVLVGGLVLSVGVLASSLSQSQIIAFVLTVFAVNLVTTLPAVLAYNNVLSATYADALRYIDVNRQFEDFAKGLLDLTNFVYFLSGTALFLFIAAKVLESKRWR